MPVGMLQMMQGVGRDQYEQVNQALFGQSRPPEDRLPDGLIMHSAGPAEGGWYDQAKLGVRRGFRDSRALRVTIQGQQEFHKVLDIHLPQNLQRQ